LYILESNFIVLSHDVLSDGVELAYKLVLNGLLVFTY